RAGSRSDTQYGARLQQRNPAANRYPGADIFLSLGLWRRVEEGYGLRSQPLHASSPLRGDRPSWIWRELTPEPAPEGGALVAIRDGRFLGLGAVRLLRSVHARIAALFLLGPASILLGPRRSGGLPVLVHVVSQRARVLGLRRTEQSARVYRGCRVAFLHS